jgi:hypothetical protein
MQHIIQVGETFIVDEPEDVHILICSYLDDIVPGERSKMMESNENHGGGV